MLRLMRPSVLVVCIGRIFARLNSFGRHSLRATSVSRHRLISVAWCRGFVSLFGQRRAVLSQSRPKSGPQLKMKPRNPSDKVLVSVFCPHGLAALIYLRSHASSPVNAQKSRQHARFHCINGFALSTTTRSRFTARVHFVFLGFLA
jgi:hypothetical protein